MKHNATHKGALLSAVLFASCFAWADTYTWTGAADNNLSNPANWAEEVVPTSGNAYIDVREPVELTVGDTFAADTISVCYTSEVVKVTSGSLHLAALTNACKLAIGAGATLEVDGDIVAIGNIYRNAMTFLYSNEGTVIVHGNAVGSSTTSASVLEYEASSVTNKPMQVGGIRYDKNGINATYFHLDSLNKYHNDGAGNWVIGENGIGFTRGATGLYAEYYGKVQLNSSADWTLENSMVAGIGAELAVCSSASMTFNTSDYNNPTVPRTITLKGRISSTNNGKFFVEGCGKVIVDTEDMSALTTNETLRASKIDVSLTVRTNATFQVNEGKKLLGENGKIVLDNGATLAFPYAGSDIDVASRVEPAIVLPFKGKAIVELDGSELKQGVPYKLFNTVPAGYAQHLEVKCNKSELLSVGLYEDEDGLYMILVDWPDKWNNGNIPGSAMLGKYGVWCNQYNAASAANEGAFLMNLNPNAKDVGDGIKVTDIVHDSDTVTITTAQDLSHANGVVYVMCGSSLDKMATPVECEFDADNGNDIVNLDGSNGAAFFKVCIGYEMPDAK